MWTRSPARRPRCRRRCRAAACWPTTWGWGRPSPSLRCCWGRNRFGSVCTWMNKLRLYMFRMFDINTQLAEVSAQQTLYMRWINISSDKQQLSPNVGFASQAGRGHASGLPPVRAAVVGGAPAILRPEPQCVHVPRRREELFACLPAGARRGPDDLPDGRAGVAAGRAVAPRHPRRGPRGRGTALSLSCH